jgi:HlyD family secretion protein
MRKVMFFLLLVAAAGGAIWYTALRPQPIPVALITVVEGEVESLVANTRAGTIKACRRAHLSPSAGGTIHALYAREGDRVKAGQILVELWSEDRQAEVSLSRSEVQAAEARGKEVCIRADEAARDAERIKRMYRDKLVSEEQVDQAVTRASAQSAACDAAKAASAVSAERLKVAEAVLLRNLLSAPFAGVVAEINGEVGEFVTPSPPGIPTPPAVVLIDDSCLYVAAPLDEVDAPAVSVGMAARVSLDAFRDRDYSGVVRRIAPYVLEQEKQARTVAVEVELNNRDEIVGLLPGYTADVEVVLESRQGLRIPASALLPGDKVLRYNAGDGTLQELAIEVGLRNWDFVEITGGLQAGDRIAQSLADEGVEAGASVVPKTDQPK